MSERIITFGEATREAMLEEMMASLEYRSFDCPSYVAPHRFHAPHPALAPA